MKNLVRLVLARLGYRLCHIDPDPVLKELDHTRDLLRMKPNDPTLWQHTLSHLALASHLRDLIVLHRPDLIVDVGANRGQFVQLIRELGYVGPIVSIEPQRLLADSLSKLAAATDPQWTIVHGAAGDSTGELMLHTYADDTFSSFHQPTATAKGRFSELLTPAITEVTQVRPLDAWIADTARSTAGRIFLKTDTQGHDLAVLRGAPGILGRASIVLAEGSLVPLYDSSASPEALAAVLAPFGLRPAGSYGLSHDNLDLAVLELDCLFTRAPR